MNRMYWILCLSSALAVTSAQTRDWNKPFPAHKVIGNVYFVGTAELGSFLITTPEGHVLINTDFESTVPSIRASVEKLDSNSPISRSSWEATHIAIIWMPTPW